VTAYDVAVVGAGPAGSSTAALLARAGYRVILLDKAHFPRDKACAEYCSPGVEDVLRRTGAWDAIRNEVRRVAGMTIFVDGRPVLPVEYSAGAISRLAFTLSRTTLDEHLAAHARKQGAEVIEGARVRRVSPERAGVRLFAVTRSGRELAWDARVVIGADGLHSTTAASMRIPARSHWPRRLGLIAHCAMPVKSRAYGEMHVGKGVYCGLAPLQDGLVNVGLVMSMDVVRRLRGSKQSLFNRGLKLLPFLGDCSAAEMTKPVRGMGPMTRRVSTVAGRGFLLVGDAAGFLDPFTGEGIYRALRGAELAAEVVDVGLRSTGANEAPDLRDYAVRRREEFRGKARLTWLIQLALSQPAVLGWACDRINGSPNMARSLGNALGDIEAAASLLRPASITSLVISP